MTGRGTRLSVTGTVAMTLMAILLGALAFSSWAPTVALGLVPGSEPSEPIPCEEDACQPLPSPPEDPTPGTLVPGPGNPPVHFPKTRKPKPPKGTGHGHGHRQPHHQRVRR